MTQDLNDYEKDVIANISKYGWFGVHVIDPKGASPNFSYSVGFPETLGSPEFIIFGLSYQLAHRMLREIFEQIKAGAEPAHGRRWSDILEGFDCISLIADHDLLYTEYLLSSDWYWRHRQREGSPSVMQLVWPSHATGLFPWEADCPESVVAAQPKLWKLPVP